MKKEYIHYGASHFSKEKFAEVKAKNHNWSWANKPDFGFWASPVETHWGWKDWCEGNDFRLDSFDKSFKFRLKNGSRILKVRMNADIAPFFYRKRDSWCEYGIKFHEIMKKYDGMELIHGDHYGELHYGVFNTWDCDSIVIWNPNIIEEI